MLDVIKNRVEISLGWMLNAIYSKIRELNDQYFWLCFVFIQMKDELCMHGLKLWFLKY